MTKIRGFVLQDQEAIMPRRGTKNSAGYDIHALRNVVIRPGQRVLVETGVATYLQPDEYLQLKSRSGMAYRLEVDTKAGTIDADFFPEPFKVLLYNSSERAVFIQKGERIAQGVFMKYLLADDDDAQAARNGGFGSTGV
jgi:dUTP pyrophosphatase